MAVHEVPSSRVHAINGIGLKDAKVDVCLEMIQIGQFRNTLLSEWLMGKSNGQFLGKTLEGSRSKPPLLPVLCLSTKREREGAQCTVTCRS